MITLALDFETRALTTIPSPPPPDPGPGEVLFRVLEVGICGTDRSLARFEFGAPPPHQSHLILGHEALGQVLSVAPDVTALQPGDLVSPMIRRPCAPPCIGCAAHRRDLCRSGNYTERGILQAHGYFTPFATDRAADLIRIPHALRDRGVWLEPLSVVEKAIATGLALLEAPPASAIVLGAGPVGLLTALALKVRAIPVTVKSLESPSAPRIRALAAAGIPYTTQSPPPADLVIEAAGSTSAAFEAIRLLQPCGAAIILGAPAGQGLFPFHDLIVGNRKIAGVVNASPQAFADALSDLHRFPPSALSSWLERLDATLWRKSLIESSFSTPKLVHVLHP